MKKVMSFFSALVLTVLFMSSVAAQSGSCDNCKKAVPTEVHTSVKNAVTLSGPPDAKGGPLEYQIFTQDRDQKWKLAKAGVIVNPGTKETFKYYKPNQLMVLLYTEHPYGSMVSFSNVKVNPENNH